jgi:hypothetical protein
MIDDSLGFQLVPWRPALEQRLGLQVSGVMTPTGVEWDSTRKHGVTPQQLYLPDVFPAQRNVIGLFRAGSNSVDGARRVQSIVLSGRRIDPALTK